ncbi:hypothetical protein [Nonomuraea basaltis]|uniref:hypothetical protein n=1 Tax=Nonomuraea basaltis TaxID=2495887 RepID=UPI001981B7D3|nr:hypothetical protein [Nonomuraea basaltis]
MPDHAYGPRGNLPDELPGFVGRVGLLAALDAQVRAAGLVTVTGMGGVGKSRLALRLAHLIRSRYRDGVWFADLSTVQDPGMVEHAVAAACGASSPAALTERVRGREMLLILDTCEHLGRSCAELAEQLLEAGSGLRIVATSRRPLGVPGEQVVVVPPLSAPVGEDTEGLYANESVRLFAARAASVARGFVLDEQTVVTVAEICRSLDGIPLAIELAATRLRTLSLERILALHRDRLDLLVGEVDAMPPRHRTMRKALEWSYELCHPAERLLWARLSVFAGSFDIEAARNVCGDELLQPEEIDGLVEALVAQSVLLTRSDYQGTRANTRYELVGVLSRYGAERLGESWQLRGEHLRYFLGLARRGEADWSGTRQLYWFERMRQEHDNVRLALEHTLRSPDERVLGLELVSSLWFMWIYCGLVNEGKRYLKQALQTNPELGKQRCKAMWVLSYVLSAQGDISDAMAMARQCFAEASRVGDSKSVILSYKMQGTAALLMGDFRQASAWLGVAIEFTEKELNPGLLPAVVEQSIVLGQQGDLAGAETLLVDCLKTCEESGELFIRSYAYWRLAVTHLAAGRVHEALDDVRSCLQIKRLFHDTLGQLMAVETAAKIYAELGQHEVAAQILGALRQNWTSAGRPRLGASWLIDDHDKVVNDCRKELGQADYSKAFDYGIRLNLDEAVDLALGTQATTELKGLWIRIAGSGSAVAADVREAIERLVREFGFDVLVDDRDGGTFYGLRFRNDAGGVTAEQRCEELDHALRQAPPEGPVLGLLAALNAVSDAVLLIQRTLVVQVGGQVEVRRLSSAELAFLGSRPHLFDDPEALIRELRELVMEVAVDGPRHVRREHWEIIADCLHAEAPGALEAWGARAGYLISVNMPVWTKRGNTDSRLLCLIVKPLSGSGRRTRKVIAKVCPPGPSAREPARHRHALEVSPAGFRQDHLVGLLPDAPSLGPDGGYLLLQEVAGRSLVDVCQLAELGSPGEIADAFQAVVSGVLRDWTPRDPEVASDLDSGAYLRAELGTRFAPGGKFHAWAQAGGLLEAEREWITFDGEWVPEVLPNPLAMAAGRIVGRHPVQHLRGFSHGDLHHGNVLIPEADADQPGAGDYWLVDLTTFRESAPLSRDPATLFHSIVATRVPLLPQAQEVLFRQLVNGADKDNLIAAMLRTLHDASRQRLIPEDFGDDWRIQFLLSSMAAALTQCTFRDKDKQIKWWFFRLAARYGAAYLRATDSWNPHAESVSVLELRDMGGFEMPEA